MMREFIVRKALPDGNDALVSEEYFLIFLIGINLLNYTI